MSTAPAAAAREPGRLVPALVIAGALALRLAHLGARSLWTDEGSTWTAASSPLAALVRRCIERDASPPLYYLLTSLALKLGSSEAWLRSVSALASVGLVWLTYRLARLFAGRREAAFAAALAALSPFQLMYAQEARTYTLVAFLAVAALYLFVRAVLLDRPRAWLPYAAVSVLALYTQSIALLGVGVQAALVVLTAPGRRRLGPWLLAQLAIALLYLPWLLVEARHAAHLGQSHWYIATPDGHGVFQVLRSVFLSPLPLVSPPPGSQVPGLGAWLPRPLAHGALALAVAVPLAAGLIAARGRGTRPLVLRALAAGLFLPLAAVLAAAVRVPLWLPRYFVLLSPMLCVLLARGIGTLRPAALAGAWAALLLAVAAYGGLRYDRDFTKEPWREVTARIAAAAPAGRAAVLVPFDVDPFAYYVARQRAPVAAIEVSHPEVPFASHFTGRQLDELEAAAHARAAGYDEVWVVVRSPNSPERRELARRAERAASAGRVLVARERWDSYGGPLRLVRFSRAAGDSTAR